MASLSLCLLYIPYIFETVMAYVHLGLFMIMILVNIFIKDEEPGNGNRTTATRVIWACNYIFINSNVYNKFMFINCRIDRNTKSFGFMNNKNEDREINFYLIFYTIIKNSLSYIFHLSMNLLILENNFSLIRINRISAFPH